MIFSIIFLSSCVILWLNVWMSDLHKKEEEEEEEKKRFTKIRGIKNKRSRMNVQQNSRHFFINTYLYIINS